MDGESGVKKTIVIINIYYIYITNVEILWLGKLAKGIILLDFSSTLLKNLTWRELHKPGLK